MNDSQSTLSPVGAAYRCSACARCFVAVDVVVGAALLCVCGGAMLPHALARGIYELATPEPCDGRLTIPDGQRARATQGASAEVDVGYGASHGYDATHGGPSGPGDAPAGVAPGTPSNEPR